LGSILWFDPRREHSSIPPAESRSRRAQGLSRLAALRGHPKGLALIGPSTVASLIGSGLEALATFKPVALGEIHAAGDILCKPACALFFPRACNNLNAIFERLVSVPEVLGNVKHWTVLGTQLYAVPPPYDGGRGLRSRTISKILW